MEIWDLLDEQGNKTERTIIKGQEIPKGYYHLGADVWIVNSENQILIQKRSPKKKHQPNVWAMTGGSVITGETSVQTIKREVEEELGVTLKIENVKLIKQYKTGTTWLDVYFVKQDIKIEDIVMEEEEVSEVKWASYKEIEQLLSSNQFMKDRWEFVRDILKIRK